MKSEFRKQVMQFAHQICRKSVVGIEQSMRLAWKAYRLSKLMKEDEVKFAYLKKDGSYREARGRLCPNPATRKSPWRGGVFVYYDLDRSEYRSFRMDYLIWPNLQSAQAAA